MFEDRDEMLDRAIRHLRRPVAVDPEFERRVMTAIREPAARRRSAAPWLALAAVVATVFVGRAWWSGAGGTAQDFRFELIAPQATTVTLVGDFNDWDPRRTPMIARQGRDGPTWSAQLPLAPGRYRYAFLVNGAEWRADPRAPAAPDDDFGTPSSVVTVERS
jgi:hypothetical protein